MISGKAWVFGNNIDTDAIIPARYLNTSDPMELAKHCMEDADTDFVKKISKGDIIVGGENFGCGSSREHAPICIKAAGISCVVAKSFARIFFRNAINMALPIFESKEAVEGTKEGDKVEINENTGEIRNLTSGKTFRAKPLPPFIQKIINSGGLINYVKEELAKKK